MTNVVHVFVSILDNEGYEIEIKDFDVEIEAECRMTFDGPILSELAQAEFRQKMAPFVSWDIDSINGRISDQWRP